MEELSLTEWAISLGRSNRALGVDLGAAARRLLMERGHEFVAEAARPEGVDLTIERSAAIAALHFPRGAHRVVVKPTAANLGLRRASELARVVTAIAAASPDLAARLPRVLGFDDRVGLIVFEYIDGQTLSSSLAIAVHDEAQARSYDAIFRDAARGLGRMQALPAEDFLPGHVTRSNASFVASLIEVVRPLASALPKTGSELPGLVFDRLTPDFFARQGDRVFLVDARSENLILRPDGGLSFIDLDVAVGAPGVGVASFLVALDRFGSRHPQPRCQGRIAMWKQSFLEGCAGHDPDFVGQDLMFFYPWTLGHMFAQHEALRPGFRPYLRWYYGRLLDRFLDAVSRNAPGDISRAPGLLFSS